MVPRIISVNGIDKRRFYQPKNQLLRKRILQCSGISINFYRTFTGKRSIASQPSEVGKNILMLELKNLRPEQWNFHDSQFNALIIFIGHYGQRRRGFGAL